MLKIRTYNQIAVRGLEAFPRERYEVASEIANPQSILLRSHKLSAEDLTPDLLAIARAGAGYNNIPVDACTERGIVVFNTPGANANGVKEIVVAGLLLASRGILPGIDYVKGLSGMSDETAMHRLLEKEKKRFAGAELAGKTLGVIGLGAIGSRVANAALGLGMEVLGFDPAISVEAAWRLSSDVQKMENLQSLLSRSDFISLHVPAIEATHHLIREETLAVVKPGAVLLNFARGDIVDSNAVIKALDGGKLRLFISDFPVPGMVNRTDVILMPHIGASTRESEENCAVMAARQLIDFLENGNITNSVNFPTLTLPRTEGYRLTFNNRNVPKVLGNVLSVLADRNVNVLDMLNKSRDEVAYNVLDVDVAPDQSLLDEIAVVEGVTQVRVPGI